MGTPHLTPNSPLQPEDGKITNDLGAIVIKLKDGWPVDCLKEFAEILKEVMKEFNDNGFKSEMIIVQKDDPKAVVAPKKQVLVTDAQGNIRFVDSIKSNEN